MCIITITIIIIILFLCFSFSALHHMFPLYLAGLVTKLPPIASFPLHYLPSIVTSLLTISTHYGTFWDNGQVFVEYAVSIFGVKDVLHQSLCHSSSWTFYFSLLVDNLLFCIFNCKFSRLFVSYTVFSECLFSAY